MTRNCQSFLFGAKRLTVNFASCKVSACLECFVGIVKLESPIAVSGFIQKKKNMRVVFCIMYSEYDPFEGYFMDKLQLAMIFWNAKAKRKIVCKSFLCIYLGTRL